MAVDDDGLEAECLACYLRVEIDCDQLHIPLGFNSHSVKQHTSWSSCTRSSMAAGGVLIRTCSRLMRQSRTASSRSLKLWTLSSRSSSAIAKRQQSRQVHQHENGLLLVEE